MIMQQWHAATTTRHSYTHVSVPYISDIQFTLLRDQKWAWQPKNFHGNPKIFVCALRTSG